MMQKLQRTAWAVGDCIGNIHQGTFGYLAGLDADSTLPRGVGLRRLLQHIDYIENYVEFESRTAGDTMKLLLDKVASNKGVYIISENASGHYVLAYSYDNRRLGFATVRLHDKLNKAD